MVVSSQPSCMAMGLQWCHSRTLRKYNCKYKDYLICTFGPQTSVASCIQHDWVALHCSNDNFFQRRYLCILDCKWYTETGNTPAVSQWYKFMLCLSWVPKPNRIYHALLVVFFKTIKDIDIHDFSLTVEHIEIVPTACIFRIEDSTGYVAAIRGAIVTAMNDASLREYEERNSFEPYALSQLLHVPNIIHSTFVRYALAA